MADATYGPKVYMMQGGDELVVASGGDITVESGGDIVVESGGDLEVESGGDIEIESGADINVASGGAITAASGSTVTVAGTLTVTGSASLGNLPAFGYSTKAGAGNSQATATAITTAVTTVTGADGTVGVVLPALVAGRVCMIINTVGATHALKVYPTSGSNVDGGSDDAAVEIAAAKRAIFMCDGADWWMLTGA